MSDIGILTMNSDENSVKNEDEESDDQSSHKDYSPVMQIQSSSAEMLVSLPGTSNRSPEVSSDHHMSDNSSEGVNVNRKKRKRGKRRAVIGKKQTPKIPRTRIPASGTSAGSSSTSSSMQNTKRPKRRSTSITPTTFSFIRSTPVKRSSPRLSANNSSSSLNSEQNSKSHIASQILKNSRSVDKKRGYPHSYPTRSRVNLTSASEHELFNAISSPRRRRGITSNVRVLERDAENALRLALDEEYRVNLNVGGKTRHDENTAVKVVIRQESSSEFYHRDQVRNNTLELDPCVIM